MGLRQNWVELLFRLREPQDTGRGSPLGSLARPQLPGFGGELLPVSSLPPPGRGLASVSALLSVAWVGDNSTFPQGCVRGPLLCP